MIDIERRKMEKNLFEFFYLMQLCFAKFSPYFGTNLSKEIFSKISTIQEKICNILAFSSKTLLYLRKLQNVWISIS